MANDLAVRNPRLAATLSLPDSLQRSLNGLTVGFREIETENGIRRQSWPQIVRSLAPSSTERQLIAKKIAELQILRDQRDPDFALAKVAELLLSMTVGQGPGESASKAKARGYLIALDDVPPWAVEEACRRWLRSEAGDQNYSFPPSPPILRQIALHCAAVAEQRTKLLKRLLDADVVPDQPTYTDEERAENLSRLSGVLRSITGGRSA